MKGSLEVLPFCLMAEEMFTNVTQPVEPDLENSRFLYAGTVFTVP